MKKIQKLAVLLGLAPIVVFSSCSNEFLDRKPTTALETSMVLTNPDLAPSTVVGNMSMFSGYGFMGRNGVIGGELMTDVATTMGKSGHLQDLEKWNIHSNMDELAGFWSYCYAVSASATQTSFSCAKLLSDTTDLTSSQIRRLRNAIACSKVIRAYCDFYLLQYFCVDYQLKESLVPGNHKNRKVGVVLIGDQPLGIDAPANMSTLEACYASIEKTLDEAITYFKESNTTTYTAASESRYFPTLCAAYMLQARVFLAKGGEENLQKALDAVGNAEDNLPSGTSKNLISNYERLYEGYKSATATSEDIWTINYTSQDNLSANSLQNFFGSYNCAISDNITNKFAPNDFRKNLYPSKPGKESRCLKYPNSTGVFNV
ncbi:MAG: RagB/SusD family nutrient uptake outer membrane protein, partial [Bacteroidales bacterium]|nr:RagB/SusD family nutrient uptake outer membrane protein [Bacteroidales bacterium]